MEVYLSLADGKVFVGNRLTQKDEACGMLSFNTSAFGFEEIITNPANTEKIIMFTFPLVGVAGINYTDNQSNIISAEAVICKENSNIYSNFRAKTSFAEYMGSNNKLYADGFDTRAIMLYLREHGEMPAVLSDKKYSGEEVSDKFAGQNYNFKQVNYPINSNKKIKAKVLDLGGSKTFYNFIDECGIYSTDDECDLIILSNATFEEYNKEDNIELIKKYKYKKIIAFGDSCVLLAKAFNYEYKSLTLGHHGVNIPVKNIKTEKDHITGQNHLYYIPEQENIKVIYKNIHDNTTEAFISADNNIAGFNFKPSKETLINTLNQMGVK